jgi:hypothetical protein
VKPLRAAPIDRTVFIRNIAELTGFAESSPDFRTHSAVWHES